MKKRILADLISKLASMGLTTYQGYGADITVNQELVDAGWSTGKKRISYEASIYANEQDNVVYMYEKTTEIGHGWSFGGGSGTSFQSGTTLYRKVQSVQYGPNGQAYEYTFDLGSIPKSVKEIAKLNGWGFKTVISKNKAMYPAKAGCVSIPGENNLQTQASSAAISNKANFCRNCGMSLSAEAKFCNQCGKPVACN